MKFNSIIQFNYASLCCVIKKDVSHCSHFWPFLGRKKTFLLTDNSLVGCESTNHQVSHFQACEIRDMCKKLRHSTSKGEKSKCCLPLSTPFISSLNKSHCCILSLPRILSDMSQAIEWQTNQQPFFMVTNMNVNSVILTKETCLVCFLLPFCPAHPTDLLFDNPFLPCHKIFQLQAHLVFGHNKNQDFSFFFS